jgi:hypothetical protein
MKETYALIEFMQPQNTGQYDFFMSPEKPSRRSMLPGLSGGNSMIMRIAVIGGIFVIIVICLVVLSSLFSSGGNLPKLTTVAQQQSELIRVATLATNEGSAQTSQSTNNFTQSCLLSMTTAQQQLLGFMSSHGKKLGSKDLSKAQDPNTDSALSAAAAASNFDSIYTTIMGRQLGSYETALKDAYSSASNSTEKQILSDDFAGAQLLVTELNSPTQ